MSENERIISEAIIKAALSNVEKIDFNSFYQEITNKFPPFRYLTERTLRSLYEEVSNNAFIAKPYGWGMSHKELIEIKKEQLYEKFKRKGGDENLEAMFVVRNSVK